MPNDQSCTFFHHEHVTKTNVLKLLRDIQDKLSPLEQCLFADLAAFTARKGFPREITLRLAEKYQREQNLNADEALTQVDDFLAKLRTSFGVFDTADTYDRKFRHTVDVLKAIINADYPNARREFVAGQVGPAKETNATITKLLDAKCIRVAQIGEQLQLVPTSEPLKILQFLRSQKGYEDDRHRHDVISVMIAAAHKTAKLEKTYSNQYTNLMLSSELVDEFGSLDKEQRKLVAAYIRAVKACATEPPTTPPNDRYYQGKDVDGPIIDFINNVYAAHLDGISFGRKELADCDPKAERALRAHENRHGKVPLHELNLPTKTQKNDALIAGLTPQQLIAARTAMQSKRRDILAPMEP